MWVWVRQLAQKVVVCKLEQQGVVCPPPAAIRLLGKLANGPLHLQTCRLLRVMQMSVLSSLASCGCSRMQRSQLLSPASTSGPAGLLLSGAHGTHPGHPLTGLTAGMNGFAFICCQSECRRGSPSPHPVARTGLPLLRPHIPPSSGCRFTSSDVSSGCTCSTVCWAGRAATASQGLVSHDPASPRSYLITSL